MVHKQEVPMSTLKASVSKCMVNEHYTRVWVDGYYYQLIGYPKEKYGSLSHNHPDEYYQNNPEGWEQLIATVADVLENGKGQYSIITRMKYEGGSSLWVKLFSYFTNEYIDGYRGTYMVMMDVTELVQMKNRQETPMQAMEVSVSLHLADKYFTLVRANDFYYDSIGYSKTGYETLFHNHCGEYFVEDGNNWNKIHEEVQEITEARKRNYELSVPLRVPDGPARWVRMASFLTNEYQDGKQMAYTTVVDVTELMQIQQEEAVACDNIPGFIIRHRVLSDRIVMASVSDRITDILNVDTGELDSFDTYSVLEPESRAMIEASRGSFRQRKPFSGAICLKGRYTREWWFSIHSACIDSIAGGPVYLTVFIDVTDVTELRVVQKKLIEQKTVLQDALEAAGHADRAKSDFLSRMSHGLRTPLNAVQGAVRIIRSHVYDPEWILDSTDKIMLFNDLLISLTNEALDTPKVESGQMLLVEGEISLAELVQDVVNMVQSQLGEKNLRFKTHVNRIIHETVVGDLQRLQQLLLNLLSNVMKYTPEGGSITLKISEKPSEQTDMAYYKFIVSDVNIGTKPGFLTRVFKPFERTDDTRVQAV